MNAPLRLVRPEPEAPTALAECSDDQLMLLAKRDHRGAFAELAARHTAWLLSLCAKLAGSVADAEEIAQDVWLAAWSHRAGYTPSARFRPYLVTVARNCVRNRARAQSRRPTAPLGELDPGESARQLERLLAEERSQRLLGALSRLDPKLREALVLRYAEELPYEEIAAALDAKSSTLRARVHHALVSLKEHFTRTP